MNIYTKTAAIIGCTLLALLMFLYLVTTSVLMDRFVRLERLAVARDLERVRKAYDEMLNGMDVMARDWSEWDEAYQFVNGRNDRFVASNVQPSTFYTLEIDHIIFLDLDGKPVDRFGFDRVSGRTVPLPVGLMEQLNLDSPIVGGALLDGGYKGCFALNNQVFLVAARPVLRSNSGGPANGVLIMTRQLDHQTSEALGERTETSLEIRTYSDPFLPDDMKDAATAMSNTSYQPLVAPMSEEKVAGYLNIRDAWEEPLLLGRITMDREIYDQGVQTVSYLLLALLLIGLVFAGLMLFLLNRMLLSRLTKMSRAMAEVGQAGRLAVRLEVDGKDEITAVGKAVNRMLAGLEAAYLRRRNAEVRQRRQNDILVRLAGSEGLLEWELDKALQLITSSAQQGLDCEQTSIWLFTGDYERMVCRDVCLGDHHDRGSLIDKDAYGLFLKEIGLRRVVVLPDALAARLVIKSSASIDFGQRTLMGVTIIAEDRVVGLVCAVKGQTAYQWDSDEEAFSISIAGLISRALNAEERRKTEADLRRMATFDLLTGLPNRASFARSLEEFLGRAQREEQIVGIMFVDLDRFKPINDASGHEVGDQVLKEVARRMSAAMRINDVVARRGGDEFTILLDHVGSPENCERVARKVIDEVARPIRVEDQFLQVGCSIGIAMSPNDGDHPEDLIQKADAAMYKAKEAGRSTFCFHGETVNEKA